MAGGPNEVVGCIAVAARGRRRGQGRETGSSSGAIAVEKEKEREREREREIGIKRDNSIVASRVVRELKMTCMMEEGSEI